MKVTHSHLYYRHKPIKSMPALSRALGVPAPLLHKLALVADSQYRLADEIKKPDGSVRQTFDAFTPLKKIHRRIKLKIFSYINFPDYLTGSLKGKDYKTNAAYHAGARIVICEDIGQFFPSTTTSVVYDIWKNFFGFSDEVADCLTRLTTKDGALPQGAITSSYLANLAFWRDEPRIQANFARLGITYSRYVDDLALSSKRFVTAEEKTSFISTVYGMFASRGYSPKRRKHELCTNKGQMFITKLLINEHPALTRKERSAIRAAVFQLEQKICGGDIGETVKKEYRRGLGRVSKLARFHEKQGAELMQRMRALRTLVEK